MLSSCSYFIGCYHKKSLSRTRLCKKNVCGKHRSILFVRNLPIAFPISKNTNTEKTKTDNYYPQKKGKPRRCDLIAGWGSRRSVICPSCSSWVRLKDSSWFSSRRTCRSWSPSPTNDGAGLEIPESNEILISILIFWSRSGLTSMCWNPSVLVRFESNTQILQKISTRFYPGVVPVACGRDQPPTRDGADCVSKPASALHEVFWIFI